MRAAIKEGPLRRGIDIDAAIDLLYGSLYYRLLLGSDTLDERFVARAFRQFVTGHGTSRLVSMENASDAG
uniref:Tetracyclin repressor-like C-terminal domain-containing protein n=1 Tax=Acidobacterium capsulatum TaxID=33075 RepID=A0A7V4XTS8_9BACT